MRFLLAAIALFGFAVVIRRFHRQQLSSRAAAAWALPWVLIGAVALQPEWTNRLADAFGIGRGADIILYGAIVVIVALLFRMSVRLEQLDRAITTVTRELALREHDQQKSRESLLSNR